MLSAGEPRAAGCAGGGVSADRLVGEWLNGYLGDRLYRCRRCGRDGLLHDAMYRHILFDCVAVIRNGASDAGRAPAGHVGTED